MSTFGVFLLAVLAFVGTILVFNNPLTKIYNSVLGDRKEMSQTEFQKGVEKLGEKWSEEGNRAEGCSFLLFLLLSLLYSFIIEPIYVIHALVNNIGYQPIGYAMLGIIAISWIIFVKEIKKMNKIKRKEEEKRKRIDNLLAKYENALQEENLEEASNINKQLFMEEAALEKKIKLPNPVSRRIRQLFFGLPTLYLWYLFLVVINVL